MCLNHTTPTTYYLPLYFNTNHLKLPGCCFVWVPGQAQKLRDGWSDCCAGPAVSAHCWRPDLHTRVRRLHPTRPTRSTPTPTCIIETGDRRTTDGYSEWVQCFWYNVEAILSKKWSLKVHLLSSSYAFNLMLGYSSESFLPTQSLVVCQKLSQHLRPCWSQVIPLWTIFNCNFSFHHIRKITSYWAGVTFRSRTLTVVLRNSPVRSTLAPKSYSAWNQILLYIMFYAWLLHVSLPLITGYLTIPVRVPCWPMSTTTLKPPGGVNDVYMVWYVC